MTVIAVSSVVVGVTTYTVLCLLFSLAQPLHDADHRIAIWGGVVCAAVTLFYPLKDLL